MPRIMSFLVDLKLDTNRKRRSLPFLKVRIVSLMMIREKSHISFIIMSDSEKGPDVVEDRSVLIVMLIIISIMLFVSIVLSMCNFTPPTRSSFPHLDKPEEKKRKIPAEEFYESTTASEHDEYNCNETSGSTKAASVSSKASTSDYSYIYDFENDSECSICLEPFDAGGQVAWSPECHHIFHQECLHAWVKRRKECPYCRTPMIAREHRRNTDASCTLRFCVVHGLVNQKEKITPIDSISVPMGTI